MNKFIRFIQYILNIEYIRPSPGRHNIGKPLRVAPEQNPGQDFAPFVVSPDGCLEAAAEDILGRVVRRLAEKSEYATAYIAGTVRATIQLAIARAASLCLRGPRRRDEAVGPRGHGEKDDQAGERRREADCGRVPQLGDAGGVAAAGGPREFAGAAALDQGIVAHARQPNPLRLRGEGE